VTIVLAKSQIPPILLDYQQAFFSFLGYVEGIEKLSIATLGPSGTSSEVAANYLLQSYRFQNAEISLFPTYETAFDSVRKGEAHLLLVANAYERIDNIYMSSASRLLLFFALDTYPYGLAKRPDYVPPQDRKLTIATHHAPSSLIPFFLEGHDFEFEVAIVHSTSEAALKAQHLETDFCITNKLAAEKYGLSFISRMYVIHMLWSVFGRNTENDRGLETNE